MQNVYNYLISELKYVDFKFRGMDGIDSY